MGERRPDGFKHTSDSVTAEGRLNSIKDDTEYATDYLERSQIRERKKKQNKPEMAEPYEVSGLLTIAQYAPIIP